MPNPREIGHDREVAILELTARVGIMTAALAAPNVCPRSSVQTGVRMTQRVLARLLDAGDLVTKRLPTGGAVYALSARGRDRVVAEVVGCGRLRRSAGTDQLRDLVRPRGQWSHRLDAAALTMAVADHITATARRYGAEVAIEPIFEREIVSAEAAEPRRPGVALGRTPGRLADGVVWVRDLTGETGDTGIWIELERTNKPARSRDRLLARLREIARGRSGQVVAAVVGGPEKHVRAILRRLDEPDRDAIGAWTGSMRKGWTANGADPAIRVPEIGMAISAAESRQETERWGLAEALPAE